MADKGREKSEDAKESMWVDEWGWGVEEEGMRLYRHGAKTEPKTTCKLKGAS